MGQESTAPSSKDPAETEEHHQCSECQENDERIQSMINDHAKQREKMHQWYKQEENSQTENFYPH